jgi:hypothetical protein
MIFQGKHTFKNHPKTKAIDGVKIHMSEPQQRHSKQVMGLSELSSTLSKFVVFSLKNCSFSENKRRADEKNTGVSKETQHSCL